MYRGPVRQLCQTNASITQQAVDPAQCTVRGEGLDIAEVHQAATVSLTKLTSKNTSGSAVVVGQLKSLYNGSVIKCDVKQSGPGEYHIQYTPIVRGHHELSVSVDGQQVVGSPFQVFVSIPPTLLGKPVKVWDIDTAVGVTTNSVGDIIVAESDGDIFKLDKVGKTSVVVKHSYIKLMMIQGVSTDDEDSIYCIDGITNRVMKCDRNGGNVQTHEVRQVKGPGYLGVAVVGDEVMLCENKNDGTIMVYTRDFKYVRRIEHDGTGKFRGVTADSHGNLYVIAINCIEVFSNDGVLQRCFNCDGNEVTRMNRPLNVWVSSHYVYVTNMHFVSVFSTAGDYVTSFGQFSHEEGSLNLPHGVSTDKDGFVYVADHGNNRVQCF